MIAPPPFDAELLRRYDRPGPRYTSYPTATQFHSDFAEAAFRQAASVGNDDPIPRRLAAQGAYPPDSTCELPPRSLQ